ncbi:MAG: POTRA domain-containing protein [Bacteroidales bacterium]
MSRCLLFAILLVTFLPIKAANTSSDERVIVSSINISGNGITNEKIIRRELTFRLNDTLLVSQIDLLAQRSTENLNKTHLFNFVTVTYVLANGAIEWTITVEERWYIWPFPILEYEDRNFSAFIKNADLSRVNYGTYIKVNNFRGMNEKIKLKLILGYRKQISLQYITNNLDRGKKHGFSIWASYYTKNEINFASIQNKPQYYVSEVKPARKITFVEAAYNFRPQHNWYHTIMLKSYFSTINDSLAILNPHYFGNGEKKSWYNLASYEITHDLRDSKIFPLAGYILRGELGYETFSNNTAPNNLYTKFMTGYYANIFNRFFGGSDLMGKFSSQSNLPYFINQAIGYIDFVRGYEYYVTNGSSFILSKNSLKFELLPTKVINLPLIPDGKFKKAHLALYLSLFADAGYVKPDSQLPSGNLEGDFIYGYGLGFYAVAYYDIVFRIEYSFNKFGENGLFLHFGTPFLIYK